jgi:hypothetical protein
MQPVTARWRREQREHFTPESFVEIKYSITDPALISRYLVIGDDQEPFSNLQETLDDQPRIYGNYMTNELGHMMLDTEFAPFADYNDNFGYVSRSICNDRARFEQPLTIRIHFDKILYQPIPGLTINWSTGFGEFARAFTLTAYLNDTLVKEQIYVNSDVECEVNFDIHNYNRIDLEISEWCLPFCRARMESMYVGFFALFNKDNLFDIINRNSADPLGSIIPENTLIFKVDNTDKIWNPANPQGLHRHLLEHQEVVARYGYVINGAMEWIDGGVFFLSEWDVPQNGNTATFTAKNIFEFMSETYTGVLSGTAYSIAISALTQANLNPLSNRSPRWIIDDKLKSIEVNVTESFQATIAQVLQLCAHAASCGLWQDRRGSIRIQPITLGVESNISTNSATSYSDISKLHEGNTVSRIITNETNMWAFNEDYQAFSPYLDYAFESEEIADEQAIFQKPPTLDITFPSEQRYVPAIVLVWSETYGEYAKTYNVNSYRRGVLTNTVEVTDNNDIHNVVFIEAPEFDYLELEIVEWCLPHRKARMEYLAFSPDYIINQFNSKPETNINVTRELRRLVINRELATIERSNIGFIQSVQNPFITTKDHALAVGHEIAEWLSRRNIYYGDFRADPRLDPLDTVLVNNNFADRIVVVNKIDYNWHGGAFWGFYEGREYS